VTPCSEDDLAASVKALQLGSQQPVFRLARKSLPRSRAALPTASAKAVVVSYGGLLVWVPGTDPLAEELRLILKFFSGAAPRLLHVRIYSFRFYTSRVLTLVGGLHYSEDYEHWARAHDCGHGVRSERRSR
jgi:hypothetical protein